MQYEEHYEKLAEELKNIVTPVNFSVWFCIIAIEKSNCMRSSDTPTQLGSFVWRELAEQYWNQLYAHMRKKHSHYYFSSFEIENLAVKFSQHLNFHWEYVIVILQAEVRSLVEAEWYTEKLQWNSEVGKNINIQSSPRKSLNRWLNYFDKLKVIGSCQVTKQDILLAGKVESLARVAALVPDKFDGPVITTKDGKSLKAEMNVLAAETNKVLFGRAAD